jgi:hypothetical protein
MSASDSMKIFHIVKLIIGIGGFPIALLAFIVRHGMWNARFTPHTRASMMPESVHIQGMVNAAALAVFCLFLIIHSILKLRKHKGEGPSGGQKS